MLMSILSFLIALGLFLAPISINIPSSSIPMISFILSVAGMSVLLFLPLFNLFAYAPFQKAEQNITPHLIESLRKDKLVAIGQLILCLLGLLLIILGIGITAVSSNHFLFALSIWIILLGISMDIMRDILRRAWHLLNPYYAVDYYVHAAKTAIANGRDAELWQWIDTLGEVAMKGIGRCSVALSIQCINAYPLILQLFFEACKSISHSSQDQAIEKATGKDETSYTLFYFIQRLEMIYSKALGDRLEPLCSLIITTIGKIALAAAKFDMSLMTFPIQILEKLTLKAQEKNFEDVAIKASCTLIEVAKTIVSEIDMTYLEIKDPFIAINRSLENITKRTFRKDKTIDIKILIEPIMSLKNLMQNEKYASHADISAILSDINRVLGEFAVLEQVMKTIPPIPKTEEPREINPASERSPSP